MSIRLTQKQYILFFGLLLVLLGIFCVMQSLPKLQDMLEAAQEALYWLFLGFSFISIGSFVIGIALGRPR